MLRPVALSRRKKRFLTFGMEKAVWTTALRTLEDGIGNAGVP